MKGLVISDCLFIKKKTFDLKSIILNILVCLVVLIFGRHFSFTFFNGLLCLSITMTPVTLALKDSQNKTIKRTITYPISMNQIVGSRFISSFLIGCIFMIFIGILDLIDFSIKGGSAVNYLFSFIACTLIGLIIMAIDIVCTYSEHQGVQGFMMIIASLTLILPQLVDFPVLPTIQSFLNLTVIAKFLILSTLMLAILLILYELSVLILKHQVKA